MIHWGMYIHIEIAVYVFLVVFYSLYHCIYCIYCIAPDTDWTWLTSESGRSWAWLGDAWSVIRMYDVYNHIHITRLLYVLLYFSFRSDT